ncbi:hypothetical protein GCM10009836_53410 [Pseudonocardia ailaonensis]|uniref:Uncharacterized protein n=1 Tax=Pseudonocardia ailaonensis TaxID=367279 RepID=A0ABN2NI51_9PSEU
MSELHLDPLPEQLRKMGAPPEVQALVEAEHARWRQLHDRLVALIVQLIDVGAEGRPVAEVIDELIGGATVGIDDLVGTTVDASEIAALLRSHGSVGEVDEQEDRTVFRHLCGSGGHYWRENPQVAMVAEGEVPGVPGDRPRYCARCVRSIEAHAGGAWTVDPPEHADQLCIWTVLTR